MRVRTAVLVTAALSLTVPAVASGATAAQAQTQTAAQVSAQAAQAAVANAMQSAAVSAKSKARKNVSKKGVRSAATVSPNPKIDETCGLDVTLTLDSSGSIGSNAGKVRQAATDFAAALKNTNSTMRITRFSKTSSQLAPRVPVNDSTTGKGGTLASGIASYPSPNGGTNWQDGFDFTRTGDPEIPELLIFVTDGDPTLWGPTGSGGTGQGTSSNIANSLAQAIPAANLVKTQAANKTRVLMVGVGNGVSNAGSRQRMTQVSGPNIVTSASGLVGKSINDVDVAAFTDFEALGAFLRSVVTSLCGNGVTVQKLAQTADSKDFVPATGWNMTVKPTVTGGYTWVDPAGQPADTAATRATAGAQGSAAFQWKPKQASNSASVRITEELKSGFTPSAWECEIRSADGSTAKRSGTLANKYFDIDMKSSDVAACVLKNGFNYAPGIRVVKTAADNPVRANADGWNETYTFTVTNTGNAALSVAKPVDSKCSNVSGPTGPGTASGQLQPGVAWTYTCTRRIVHPTVTGDIVAPNTVTVVGTDPNGTAVTDQDTINVNVKTPAIEVVKTAKKTEGGDPVTNGGTVAAGTRVTYVYTVNNVGNDELKNVTIADDRCSTITRTTGTGTTLPVGDTWVYECLTTINPPSAVKSVRNTVTVESNWSNPQNRPQNNGKVTDSDTFLINVDRSASLTVVKSTNPGATDQDFDFTLSGQGVPTDDESFTLNSGASPGSITVELDGPAGGGSVYTATEAAVTGWTLTGADCIDQDGNVVAANFDAGTRTITPTIVPEQDVTCTFTNERQPSLSIVKRAPGGAAAEFDFTASRPGPLPAPDPASFALANGESQAYPALPPGAITVTEGALPAGWELDDIVCSGTTITDEDVAAGLVTLDLAYGEDAECIFVNAKLAPANLTIVKDGQSASWDPSFPFEASGTGLVDPGQPGSDTFSLGMSEFKNYQVRPVAGGNTYTITEDIANLPTPPTGESGYVLTELECVKNGDVDNPIVGDTGTGVVEITLAPGDTGVCTYVNKVLPRLTVVKNAVNPADPGDPAEFTFTPSGAIGTTDFTLANNEEEIFTDISPSDALGVTEVAEAEWTLTSLGCTGVGSDALTIDVPNKSVSGDLAYGDDVVCTYVNTKEPAAAYLFVMKNTDPAGSAATFDFNATDNDTFNEDFQLVDGDYAGFEIDPGFGGADYTVTEAATGGWKLTGLDCVKSTDPGTLIPGDLNTGQVTLNVVQGEVAVCVYENQKLATLTIDKVTDEASVTEFPFTASSTPDQVDPTSFTLVGGGAPQTYTDIPAGNAITITENVPTAAPDRWSLSDITCTGTSSPSYDLPNGEVSFTIGAGEDVECTYTDLKVPEATVEIVKEADPADGTSFDFTASGADGGVVPDPADECDPVVAGQACFTLTPDGGPDSKTMTIYPAEGGETFTFAEPSVPDDWNLDDIVCTDNGTETGTPDFTAAGGLVDVTIDPGDTVVCTFTDREDAKLTVVKQAPDDVTQSFDFDWTPLTPNTFSLTDGQQQQATGLEPGDVTVSEVDLPVDWYLAGAQGEHPDCVGAATVDYSPTNGATVSVAAGEDIVCTFTNVFDYRPAIQLDKTVSRSVVVKGQTVDYTYVLTNTGNVDLAPVGGDVDAAIVDDKCSLVTYSSGGAPPILSPGDQWTYTCTGYQVDEDTLNTATATMIDVFDEEVTSTDTEFVEELTPAMELLKYADKQVVYAGTEVTYTYDLVNTGETDLQNQTSPADRDAWVTDDKCAPVTYVSGDTGDDDILAVGEVWVYTCTGTINVATTNVATATATALDPDGGAPVGEPLVDTDEQTVDVIKGDITVAKTATAPGGTMQGDVLLVPIGSTVTYKYDVTSGDATVGMQVLAMADDKCSPVEYQSGDTNDNGLVDPGETWKYECKKDFDGATTVTNTVAVTAVEPTLGGVSVATDQAKVESYLGSITLDKEPDRDLIPKGSAVTYTYRATNDGTTDLTNISLTDDKCSPVTYVSGDDGDGVMKPGDTWVYECSTTLSKTTTNVADVTGKTPVGGTVTATDSAQVVVFNPANLDAKIKVKKSASKTKVKKGAKVTYTYKVSNPGKVALAKVKQNMTDNKCRPVKYIRGDKDHNNLLTSGREPNSEFAREVWVFTCKSKIKKTTVNTVTAKGKGWLNGEIVGPTVKDKAKAKVRVIGSGGGKNNQCKHHGLGWATAAQLKPWATAAPQRIKCKKGKG